MPRRGGVALRLGLSGRGGGLSLTGPPIAFVRQTVPVPASRLRLCRCPAMLARLLLFHACREAGLARANHVTPPAYAEQATDKPQLARHDHEDDHVHPASAGHAAGCDHATAGHNTAGRSTDRCCRPHARHVGSHAPAEESLAIRTCRAAATDSKEDPGPVQFVSNDAWRKCRGLPTLWVASAQPSRRRPPPAGNSLGT